MLHSLCNGAMIHHATDAYLLISFLLSPADFSRKPLSSELPNKRVGELRGEKRRWPSYLCVKLTLIFMWYIMFLYTRLQHQDSWHNFWQHRPHALSGLIYSQQWEWLKGFVCLWFKSYIKEKKKKVIFVRQALDFNVCQQHAACGI